MKTSRWPFIFHSIWHPSGGVTRVPGGSKNGPFRGLGFHFGIAIAMSWATWGPFLFDRLKTLQSRLVNSTAVFSFKMDIGVVMTCVNFSFYRVCCHQLPFGAEPVSSFWYRRASVFCFESDSWAAYMLQIRFSCGHIIHWWHFEVKAWLTRGRSVPFSNDFHKFRCPLLHSMQTNEDLTCASQLKSQQSWVTEYVIMKASHRAQRQWYQHVMGGWRD